MPNGHGFSFPYGVPIVVYAVLAVGVTSQRWWGMLFAVIAVLLAAVFTWEGLSLKEYESIRKNDPTLNLTTWRFNWLVFFALPGYVIGGLGLVGRIL